MMNNEATTKISGIPDAAAGGGDPPGLHEATDGLKLKEDAPGFKPDLFRCLPSVSSQLSAMVRSALEQSHPFRDNLSSWRTYSYVEKIAAHEIREEAGSCCCCCRVRVRRLPSAVEGHAAWTGPPPPCIVFLVPGSKFLFCRISPVRYDLVFRASGFTTHQRVCSLKK